MHILWCSGREVWQRDWKGRIQGIAQSQVMQRGGPVESWGEPVRLLISKFNTVHIEGLIISGGGGQSIWPIKKKVLKFVESRPIGSYYRQKVRCSIWLRKPQTVIGSGEDICTRRRFSCTSSTVYLCLPSQESWSGVTGCPEVVKRCCSL